MPSRPSASTSSRSSASRGDLARDRALVADLGDVAHAAKNAVRDPRRPARPARDLHRRVVCDLDAENPCGAPHDRPELLRVVVAEPERHPEAVAQRRRQESPARCGADESEGRQVERECPRGRPLADDDVEPEVLERGIEDLLDRPVDPVDLVDEEHVPRLERGQDRRHVALALEGRAGDRADADVELLAHDLRERRLAEPGRPDQEHVVERLVAGLRGGECNRQLLLDALLPDEVGEAARAEGRLECPILLEDGAEEAAHAASLACGSVARGKPGFPREPPTRRHRCCAAARTPGGTSHCPRAPSWLHGDVMQPPAGRVARAPRRGARDRPARAPPRPRSPSSRARRGRRAR